MRKCTTLALFAFLLASSLNCLAVTKTATSSGSWNSTATWGGSSVPGSSDDVVINEGVTVTVDANASCKSLAIGTIAANGSHGLTINNGVTLSVIGAISLTPAASSPFTLTNNGTLSQTASSSVVFASTNATFTSVNNGTANIGSLYLVGGSHSGSGSWNLSLGLSLSGNIAFSSTLSSNAALTVNSAVAVSGTGKMNFTGNLTVTSASVAISYTGKKLSCNALSISNSGSAAVSISADTVIANSTFSLTNTGTGGNSISARYLQSIGNFTVANGSAAINTISTENFKVGGNFSLSNSSATAVNSVIVKSSATITGNYTMSSTANSSTGYQNLLACKGSVTISGTTGLSLSNTQTGIINFAQNVVQVGSADTTGSLVIYPGNIVMSSSQSSGNISRTDTVNLVAIYNGSVSSDSVLLTTSSNGTNNMIYVNDNGSYDGKSKSLSLTGGVSNASKGSLKWADANSNTSFITYFNGTSSQTIPASDNWNFKKINVSNTSDSVIFGGTLGSGGNRLTGRLIIDANAKVSDGGYDFGGSGSDSIQLGSGANFYIRSSSPTFPSNVEYVSNAAGGTINFTNTGSSTLSILSAPSTPISLGNVAVSGSGIKSIAGIIGSSTISIENLTVAAGTLTFGNACTLLNLVPGSQPVTKTITVAAGATLQIPRDFSSDPTTNFVFAPTATLEYSGGSQKVYNIIAGNLTFSGSGTKSIAANGAAKAQNKVTISGTATLNIGESASLTLLSTASQTAYIAEITGGGITYSGTGTSMGKVIAQRYVELNDGDFRDFTSPIKNSTLESWQGDGMLLTGITGSYYPDFGWINAYTYNEATGGDFDLGWIEADNVTNKAITYSGSNMVRGGWRIYDGYNGGSTVYTLQDEGEVNTGTIPMTATFTHASASGDREQDDGWNFMGNPYPAGIDFAKFYADNAAVFESTETVGGLEPTVYVWQPSDRSSPGGVLNYGGFNAITGSYINMSDGVIPANNGFWLKAYESESTSKSYSLNLKESHKYNGAGAFHKAGTTALKLIDINFTDPNGYTDMVKFHEWFKATEGYDRSLDIQKFKVDPSVPVIDIRTEEDKPIWVNATPDNGNSYQFSLHVRATSSGVHTLDWSGLDIAFEHYRCAMLTDHVTGTVINMEEEDSYSFTMSAGYEGNRFTVEVSKKSSNNLTVTDASCAGLNDGKVMVDLSNAGENYTYTLVNDANGQTVTTFNSLRKSVLIELAAGEYTLKASDINKANDKCGSSAAIVINDPMTIAASFTKDKAHILAGAEVNFISTSKGAAKLNWEFGDDLSVSADESVKHTFTQPGTYTVELTASNAEDGCKQKTMQEIVVHSAADGSVADSRDLGIVAMKGAVGYTNPYEGTAHITVFTTDGKLVYSQDLNDPSGMVNLEKTGCFVVTISCGEKSQTRQLVIF